MENDNALMEQISSDEMLNQAFQWLCHQRKEYSHNNDVWETRCRWEDIRLQIQQKLLAGEYRFSPQQEIRTEQQTLELWCSQDALVLKAVALVLTRHLKPGVSTNCHLQVMAGLKEPYIGSWSKLKTSSSFVNQMSRATMPASTITFFITSYKKSLAIHGS